MKQVILSYRTGALSVVDVPAAAIRQGMVLVRNVNSVVSAGTEKLVIDLAQKSLAGKALARPDQVKRVINKARTDGILEAYQRAANRLDTPVPLGYSCAGEVATIGDGITEVHVGDRVACAGQGYASHAEIVCVPKNLCARIPDAVNFESASFVMLGAIALHGVRMAQPTLGERVVVLGLGLLGQITVQILRAAGCHVFGVDLVPEKVSLAQELGAEEGTVIGRDNVGAAVAEFTQGVGADAVLILAGTASNQPIEMAGEICRERGRIVAVGAVRLDVPRNLFYEKELSVVVSRSSGPGIYDPQYEQKGIDYPLPYVRWTQRRNMEEFLELVAQGQVKLAPLITHRFPIERATEAYDLLLGKTKRLYIGVLLTYPTDGGRVPTTVEAMRHVDLRPADQISHPAGRTNGELDTVNIGLIGAGLFAKTTLLPALRKVSNVHLRGVVTATGTSARHIGDKFRFDYCTTDYRELLNDPDIECVLIATRHNLHAPLAVEALQAGKHVFVEKPLALNLDELRQVVEVYQQTRKTGREGEREGSPARPLNLSLPLLVVGFNRRFSPFAVQAKQWLTPRTEPLVINCRVNAGFVPGDTWVHDPVDGGGRIIGEVCHFVDLIQYFTDSVPVRVYAEAISNNSAYFSSDNVVITLKMADGSVATITYAASGDRAFPRERVEILGSGNVCVIDNFKSLSFVSGGKTRRKRNLLSLDRGHEAELKALASALRDGTPLPVTVRDHVYTTLTTFCIEESLRKGQPVGVDISQVMGLDVSKDEDPAP